MNSQKISNGHTPKADFYRSAFQGLASPAVVINSDADIKDANAAFQTLVGVNRSLEGTNASLFDYTIPGDHERISAALVASVTPDCEVPFIETALVTLEGHLRRVRIHLNRLPGTQRIIATVLEKTGDTESQSELKQRTDDLENLFYLISHNLKSPIVSIQGFARLLLENQDISLDAESERYLQRVKLNADKMNLMIQDILTFSRLSSRDIKPRDVDLLAIIDGIRAECFFKVRERKIDFVVAPDLPTVTADPKGIAAVFHNLVENSIKYMGQPEDPKIEIGWEEKRRFFVFWVKDNGPGVPEKFHESVFELFERALAPGSTEGTGVGLAVVKRIVERHGGFVRLSNAQDRGTQVYFTLPKIIRTQ